MEEDTEIKGDEEERTEMKIEEEMKEEKQNSTFPCQVCNKPYNSTTGLRAHMKKHHPGVEVPNTKFFKDKYPQAFQLAEKSKEEEKAKKREENQRKI